MIMIHKGLTPEKWYSFSLVEQLANIGMDVGRTFDWKKKGDIAYSNNAFERAMELLYLTIEDPKNKRSLRELTRVREFLVDHVLGSNEYQTTEQFWHDYFYEFCYAAALIRERAYLARMEQKKTQTKEQ